MEFLLSGVDRTGERSTLRIDAADAQQACERMAAQGYTDIVLHSDDAAAVMSAHFPDADGENALSGAEMVDLRALSGWWFMLYLFKKQWQSAWWVLVPCAVLLAYRLWTSAPLGLLGIAAIVLLCFPPAHAIYTAFFSVSRRYDMLLEAGAWGRWQEVLKRVPALRGKVPDMELDARAAFALAGLGRLDEGLTHFAQYAQAEDVPRWMYLGRLAEIYDTAQCFGDALQCHRRAHEAAPENPTVTLDLAMALLKNGEELDVARHLISAAEHQHLSDLIQLVLPFAKGLLALNSRDHLDAEKQFKEAEGRLQPLAGSSPLVRLIIDFSRGYRAIAMARAGEWRDAETLFRKVKPRIEALGDIRVLRQFEEALLA